MLLKASFAIALLASFSASAFAQDAMKPAGAMASDDHMMAADHAMAPMSKADKAMMMKCHKMKLAAVAKNAKCAKVMAMHHGSHM
jgi:hypothetical protein